MFSALKLKMQNSLINKINSQLKSHKKRGYHFSEVVLQISCYYNGVHIKAYLLTSDPYKRDINDSNAVYFYEQKVDTWIQGIDKINYEVSMAKSEHPDLDFFLNTIIPMTYDESKIEQWSSLSIEEKAKYIEEGSVFNIKSFHIMEQYENDTWNYLYHSGDYD